MINLFDNRRTRILAHALSKKTFGGSFYHFVRNVFAPTCSVLASRRIESMHREGECRKIFFKGYTEPFFFPVDMDMLMLYQIIAEQFYPWTWHYYEVEQTRVDNDVVFDCGAAEGLFSYLVYKRADHVFCFKPLVDFHHCLEKTFENVDNITIVPSALGDKTGSAYLKEDGIVSIITQEETPCKVELDTIDNFCSRTGARPSYIKADLEGYEMKLLEGARDTIRMLRPRIAITTYHKPGDALALMQVLKDINPEYHFRLKGIEDVRDEPVILHAW